jgi:hypothetical protein
VNDATPVHLSLATMRAVLDTVRITASGRSGLPVAGLEERRRAGNGQFLSGADIARRSPIVTTDLLRNLRGVVVEDSKIFLRAAVGDMCEAQIFFNGHHMPFFELVDVNGLASPKEITAIEVYTGASTPVQYQVGLSGCGSILIWTR